MSTTQVLAPSNGGDRINRFQYLGRGVSLPFALKGLGFLLFGAMASHFKDGNEGLLLISAGVFLAAAVLAILASVKRLHDLGQNGWAAVLLLLPVVNLLFVLVLAFVSGEAQSNRYGSPPSDRSELDFALVLSGPVVLVLLILVGIGL